MHRHANWLLKSWQQLLSSGDAEGACCSLAFFLCFHWMIVQLQEGEKERNLLTAIHPLPVPHPRVQLCVFGVEMGIQAAPRMCCLVATGLVLHSRVRHGQTGFPQSVYTDKLLRHVCHVKECPSVSDAHRQCVHREGLLCCCSVLHNSLHVFDR